MTPDAVCVWAWIAWNALVCAIYGADKRRARLSKRRVSEKALLSMAFLLGGVGAFIGMRLFRHKTKHTRFVVCVPLAAMLSTAAVWGMMWLLRRG